ncbi:hypothetical protein EJ06DRAFT_555359 [Trichodelitschia bisporula]|uniref:Uncharacterized protein n=1 Tax=Trichodelitschia bisporula TaxID=703511 RepID=A0A6G1I0B8_9PEZI|nr:hypothetical protein EJ06DRAFT_555359 [Trichodelitschia bisporula]
MKFILSALALLASVAVVSAGPPGVLESRQTTCDVYACGWCHWYYNNKPTPDGGSAYTCLNMDGSEREPCPFCFDQPYCC